MFNTILHGKRGSVSCSLGMLFISAMIFTGCPQPTGGTNPTVPTVKSLTMKT
ncbi:MAG: hypothetical protein IJ191_02635 [Treponema sp.]|nr:hypothetical protein [Treponema sp.]